MLALIIQPPLPACSNGKQADKRDYRDIPSRLAGDSGVYINQNEMS